MTGPPDGDSERAARDGGARRPTEPVRRTRLRSFHELMQHRVRRILLVTSLYDSFVMSEEGQVAETVLRHFLDLDRGSIPDLVQVADGATALELLEEDARFDLVVASLRFGGGDAAELARELRARGHAIPLVALGYSSRELHRFRTTADTSAIDRLFLWQGDVRIFLAIVLSMEDRLNVAHDTGSRGVPAIILVEDNVRFYSSYLVTIYSELLRHTAQLLSEDLNLSQKMVRLRARPKVLLSTSFEEAWGWFERYEENVLGVISDLEFPMGGALVERAGLELCRRVLARRPNIRLVLQSSDPENRERARELGASFLVKGSPMLLQGLRDVLVERFGFGDFIFRAPDGSELDRARDLRMLGRRLARVPGWTVAYHASHNHLSNWVKARTEFTLAERLQPIEDEHDAADPEELRAHLLAALEAHRQERGLTFVADFDRQRFDPTVSMTRVGSGSLGGKARSIVFANRMLLASRVAERFPEIDVAVPPAAVVATDAFDEFLAFEWTHELALRPQSDTELVRLFFQAPFPREAGSKLLSYLHHARYPLAVRSSSLMEDSLSHPFAGVYETYMLPNNDPELDVRWRQLTDAVKRVWASTFSEQAKAYLSMGAHRIEEEKMAVMVQELVGRQHGDRFYPDFSGVARSHNFYPEPGQAAEDGVAAVALGMGKAVVGGDPCLRFSPRHPRHVVGFSSVRDALQSSQRDFWALDLRRETPESPLAGLVRHPLEVAEEDGTLTWLGSTYLPDDDRIVDGLSRPGPRLVSFAQILKHEAFPLARLLEVLLRACAEGTGAPVEIEFAGDLGGPGRRPRFALLQLRPMAIADEGEEVEIGAVRDESLLCRSDKVLGNGRIEDVHDLVVVDRSRFERARTREVAQQVAGLDALMRKEGRPYVLVGLGRWGSADPSLGIPVGWNQIAGARVIVEAGFEDLKVAPSQGTHFFQNLTSGNVGYFTVNPEDGEGLLDWDWLLEVEPIHRTEHVRCLRFAAPVPIRMDGRSGTGVIEKPASSAPP